MQQLREPQRIAVPLIAIRRELPRATLQDVLELRTLRASAPAPPAPSRRPRSGHRSPAPHRRPAFSAAAEERPDGDSSSTAGSAGCRSWLRIATVAWSFVSSIAFGPGRKRTTMSACSRCGRMYVADTSSRRSSRSCTWLVGVAALLGVARHLPAMAQRLRRVEVHAHIVARAERRRVQPEQPLDDQKLGRSESRAAHRSRRWRDCMAPSARPPRSRAARDARRADRDRCNRDGAR